MSNRMQNREAGLSLVELMVSLLLGMILMLAILQVFHNSKNTLVLQRAVTLMQENGRFAVKSLRRDLAIAGFSGCRADTYVSNIVTNSHQANEWHLIGPGFVRGHDNAAPNGSWPQTFRRKGSGGLADDNTDAIVVRGGDPGLSFDVASSNLTLARITMAGDAATVTANFSAGDLLFVTNNLCSRQAVFHLDSVDGQSLVFGGLGATGNCSSNLLPTAPYVDCADTGSLSNGGAPLAAGSQVRHYRAIAYYIGDSDSGLGVPALRRVVTYNNGGVLDYRHEEVVEGVETMQIRYGYDIDGDGFANVQVAAAATVEGESWQWEKVVNVKITLVLRSTHATETENGSDVVVEGLTIPGDRHLRTVVSTLVDIRNRPPRPSS